MHPISMLESLWSKIICLHKIISNNCGQIKILKYSREHLVQKFFSDFKSFQSLFLIYKYLAIIFTRSIQIIKEITLSDKEKTEVPKVLFSTFQQSRKVQSICLFGCISVCERYNSLKYSSNFYMLFTSDIAWTILKMV